MHVYESYDTNNQAYINTKWYDWHMYNQWRNNYNYENYDTHSQRPDIKRNKQKLEEIYKMIADLRSQI